MRESDRPRQLPLSFSIAEGRTRDDLVVTSANREAVALIDGWPDWPTPVVVLAGPAGSGKSHIGAAWCTQSGAAALDPRKIDSAAIEALAPVPAFLEDADQPGLDETGLFHAINAARENGTTLLIASRKFPAAWGLKLPDLQSRLKAATTIEIREPDDELLSGVITKLFADRQVEIEPHVVQFIVRRIERSLASAVRVVNALDRAALERKMPVTRALAADLVKSMDAAEAEPDFWDEHDLPVGSARNAPADDDR